MSGIVILCVAVTWLAIGLALSLTMGGRGHDWFSWLVLGTMLGPVALAFAFVSWRDERLETQTLATGTRGHADGIDALVGFDGSPESRAALAACIELFGDRLGRLTLVTVVPFDSSMASETEARAILEAEAVGLGWLAPSLEVVHGHPAHALAAAAKEDNYLLLVVGTRGSGRAHLFCSVASDLTRASKVPVLLVGANGATFAETTCEPLPQVRAAS